MTPAYYATYTRGHHGARDRIGGLPTHLPAEYPACERCGEPFTFLMQLYVDDKEYAHLLEDKLGGCFIWCDDDAPARQLGAIGQFCALGCTVYLYNDPKNGLRFEYF